MPDPFTLAAIASAVGGLGGSLLQRGDDKNARRATRALGAVEVPGVEQLLVDLGEAIDAGRMTPAQAQAVLTEASRLESFREDPRLRAAQNEVLEELASIALTEGLDPQTQAAVDAIQDSLAAELRGEREAVLAQARAQGLGGSGLELAAKLQAGQEAAQRAQTAGFQQAALADQQRRAALEALASGASAVRTQDFGQEAQRAAAADAINRFNTANRQAVIESNAARRQAAALANLRERQRQATESAELRRQQAITNREAPLDVAELNLRKAGGLSSAFLQRQRSDTAARQRQAGALGGGLAGIGDVLTAKGLGQLKFPEVK